MAALLCFDIHLKWKKTLIIIEDVAFIPQKYK